MRLSIEFEMSSEKIPKDYRRGFLSIIKKAVQLENEIAFEKFFADYKLKPFTFSVYFPSQIGEDGDFFIVGKKARLDFSTSSLELGTYLYNGCFKIKKFDLFNNTLGQKNTISFKKAFLQRNIQITKEEVIFKTISPVLVSNKGSSDWYLIPGDEKFEEGLKFSVKEIAREFLNSTKEFPFEFIIFEKENRISIKKKIVWHYNMHRSGFVGTFKIKSIPEVLQLIYDIGLGVRRSQGFGMLEVIK